MDAKYRVSCGALKYTIYIKHQECPMWNQRARYHLLRKSYIADVSLLSTIRIMPLYLENCKNKTRLRDHILSSLLSSSIEVTRQARRYFAFPL